jgi:purine-nucleoside phosphorylase
MMNPKPSGQKRAESSVFSAHDFVNHAAGKSCPPPRLPLFCILGFFPSINAHLKGSRASTVYNSVHPGHPYRLFKHHGREMAYQLLCIGAPAAGLLLEEGIALGAGQFVFLGTAGVLDETIPAGAILLPGTALSDEGTSRHYRSRAREASADIGLVQRIQSHMDKHGIHYHLGKTWTTDAPFRETPQKIRRAFEAGCISVDMEASALYTISEYYQKKIAGIFIATDVITEEKWIPRSIPKTNDAITPVGLFNIIADLGSGIQENADAKK